MDPKVVPILVIAFLFVVIAIIACRAYLDEMAAKARRKQEEEEKRKARDAEIDRVAKEAAKLQDGLKELRREYETLRSVYCPRK